MNLELAVLEHRGYFRSESRYNSIVNMRSPPIFC